MDQLSIQVLGPCIWVMNALDNIYKTLYPSYLEYDGERRGQPHALSSPTQKPSTARKRYFVKGSVNGTPVEASPDTGADVCYISETLTSQFGLFPVQGTQRVVKLGNMRRVRSPGMVKMSWEFKGESKSHMLKCWILPGCVQDLILGNAFLRMTNTLTTFIKRIESRLVIIPTKLRLQYLGNKNQRLCGFLDGNYTTALADTGSDIMLISRKYARHLGLGINRDLENRLEIEMGDGSTAWTSGVVQDVPWSVGGKEIRCDFHVLDSLCADVVLSNDYLFDFNAFSEFTDHFIDASVEKYLQLCNIRLIGQYAESLSLLEEEYLSDINSMDAFGPEKVQRELARRDHIRDEIMTLPDEQRSEAILKENERQRRWEDLRASHLRRLQSRITDVQPSNGDAGASDLVVFQGTPIAKPRRKDKWRRRLRASLRRDLT